MQIRLQKNKNIHELMVRRELCMMAFLSVFLQKLQEAKMPLPTDRVASHDSSGFSSMH